MKRALFVHTRPIERQNAAAYLPLTKQGVDTFCMPLLFLRPQSDPNAKRFGHRLAHGEYKLLLAVSPTAAERGLAALSDDDKAKAQALSARGKLTCVAVGKASAKPLCQAGFVAQTPLVNSNEGMLQMACIKNLKAGDAALIWKGEGGRQTLIDALCAKGVAVDCVLWYARKAPDDLPLRAQELKTRLGQYRKVFFLVSSAQAWQNWLTIAARLDICPQNFHYIALGERITRLARRDVPLVYRVNDLDGVADVVCPLIF